MHKDFLPSKDSEKKNSSMVHLPRGVNEETAQAASLVSEAHLQRYASEFAFRWNYRKVDDAERANAILKAAQGKRLTYRRPDEAENG